LLGINDPSDDANTSTTPRLLEQRCREATMAVKGVLVRARGRREECHLYRP
jgi:hypothetical protein